MTLISADEIAKVPFIKAVPCDGRSIRLQAFRDRDAGEWVFNHSINGSLVRMNAEPVVGFYWGQEPEDSTKDFYIPLCDLICQHLSWPRVAGAMEGLEEDFHNLGAILDKYLLISDMPASRRSSASQIILTELEYLIIIVRSMYDGLQKVCKQLASVTRSTSPPHDRIIDDLPASFAKVVIDGRDKHLRSEDELVDRFRLPQPIAQFYHEEGHLFQILRTLRVGIEHYGASPGLIVNLDEGMAILTDTDPWQSLPVWRQGTLINNNCGSLHALFLFLAEHIISVTSKFAYTYASCIAMPEAICPGWHLYLRDYCSHHLVSLKDNMENPWER